MSANWAACTSVVTDHPSNEPLNNITIFSILALPSIGGIKVPALLALQEKEAEKKFLQKVRLKWRKWLGSTTKKLM